MSNPIGWCDCTINPVVGCTKCSPGCEHCYAEKFAARLAKNPKTAKKYAGVVDTQGRWTGKINVADDLPCDVPGQRKRVFVGSMCDIFHPNVSHFTRDEIFAAILCDYLEGSRGHGHTFLILTKRTEQMFEYFSGGEDIVTGWLECILGVEVEIDVPFPLPHLWLGATVCNQAEADSKIPFLLNTPAAKRFLSVEPMLGPVDLTRLLPSLDWVICGGETGPGARPVHPEWVRLLRDQCQSAGVPFYFKGWGGTKKAPALLDGREWREFPARGTADAR